MVGSGSIPFGGNFPLGRFLLVILAALAIGVGIVLAVNQPVPAPPPATKSFPASGQKGMATGVGTMTLVWKTISNQCNFNGNVEVPIKGRLQTLHSWKDVRKGGCEEVLERIIRDWISKLDNGNPLIQSLEEFLGNLGK